MRGTPRSRPEGSSHLGNLGRVAGGDGIGDQAAEVRRLEKWTRLQVSDESGHLFEPIRQVHHPDELDGGDADALHVAGVEEVFDMVEEQRVGRVGVAAPEGHAGGDGRGGGVGPGRDLDVGGFLEQVVGAVVVRARIWDLSGTPQVATPLHPLYKVALVYPGRLVDANHGWCHTSDTQAVRISSRKCRFMPAKATARHHACGTMAATSEACRGETAGQSSDCTPARS